MGGAATADLPAFGTLGDDDIPLLGIGLGGDGLQIPPAGVGAVAGVDVHVEGPEAEGTVIAGGVAQRFYFLSAMGADESAVVLFEAFFFHFYEKNPFFLLLIHTYLKISLQTQSYGSNLLLFPVKVKFFRRKT